MKDVIVKIGGDSQVYLNKKTLGISGENLQGDIVFEFVNNFVDGTGWLEITRPNGESGYLGLNKSENTYTLPILSSLLKDVGNIEMQLRITEDNATEMPIFKSNKFYLEIKEAINSIKEIPEEYPQWIDVANAKIAEIDNALEQVDNLDIEVETSQGTTKVIITRKDGSQEEATVSGASGTTNYEELENKPKINNVELIGNVSLDKLNVQPKGDYLTEEDRLIAGENITIEDNVISAIVEIPDKPVYYDDLYNKPQINSVELNGNKTTKDLNISYNDLANLPLVPTKTSELTNDSNFAKTNENNNFTASQTINGTLTVNGDIVQNGESYETHAEKLYTEKDEIITRDGAVGGLSEGELTGIRAKKYDGANDGQLGFDANGEARVGDAGDTQPLLTRDEIANLTNGEVLVWDGTHLKAVGSSEYVKFENMPMMTQEEYDALENKDDNTYYYIPEEE